MPPRRALREKPRASQSVQSLNHGNGIKEEKLGGDVGGADFLNKKARNHGDMAENVKTYRTKRKRGRPRKSSTMDDDDDDDDDEEEEDDDDEDEDEDDDDDEDEVDDKEDQGEVSDSGKEKVLRQKGHENRRKEEAKDQLHLHSSISKEEESVMHSNQTNSGHIHHIKNHNNKKSYGNGNGNGKDNNHQNNENDEDNKNPNNKSKFRKKKKESSKSSPVAPGKERDGVSRAKSVDLAHKVSTNIHLAIPLLKSSIGSKRMRRRKGHPSRAAEACL